MLIVREFAKKAAEHQAAAQDHFLSSSGNSLASCVICEVFELNKVFWQAATSGAAERAASAQDHFLSSGSNSPLVSCSSVKTFSCFLSSVVLVLNLVLLVKVATVLLGSCLEL